MVDRRSPTVSIGLPVYNGEKHLEAAIESILHQTYEDFELIIVDNASTDQTPEICRSYAAQDRRVRYLRNAQNIGAMPNFNRAFNESSGKYFKWASHDDTIDARFIQKCKEVLDSDPQVVLCYSATVIINENGDIVDDYPHNGKYKAESTQPSERFRSLIDFSHWCIYDFGLFRADALRKTRLYESYTASDRVLLVRAGFLGRFYEVPERLFFYRTHAQQSLAMVNRGTSLLLYAIWNDPKNADRIMLPIWRLYYELFVAVQQAHIRPLQRQLCHLHLLRWPWRNGQARRMAKDLIIAAGLKYARICYQSREKA